MTHLPCHVQSRGCPYRYFQCLHFFFFNVGKPRHLRGTCTCFGSQSKQVGELTPGVSFVGISESLSLSINALLAIAQDRPFGW